MALLLKVFFWVPASNGLAGCMIASIKRQQLRELFNIPSQFEIILVLAIGKPKEETIIETVGPDNDIRYWRDASAAHHVPKRSLNDIIFDTCP